MQLQISTTISPSWYIDNIQIECQPTRMKIEWQSTSNQQSTINQEILSTFHHFEFQT